MTLYNVNGQRPITPTSIMTASRRYVDLLDPHPDVVDLGDLARGLEEPRFRGQTQAPITVEDHMLRCARFGLALSQPIDVILALLMHDAPEAYLGDMPGPIKRFVKVDMPDGSTISWSELERRWLVAVCDALFPSLTERVVELVTDRNGPVAMIDHLALRTEALLGFPGAEAWAFDKVINTSLGSVPVPGINPLVWPAMFSPASQWGWRSTISMVFCDRAIDGGSLDVGFPSEHVVEYGRGISLEIREALLGTSNA